MRDLITMLIDVADSIICSLFTNKRCLRYKYVQ